MEIMAVAHPLLGAAALQESWPPGPDALSRGLPPGAHYAAAYAATGNEPFVVTFFSLTRPEGGSAWFARKQSLFDSGAAQTQWASASSCPALYATLDWLSDIQPPAIALNGLRRLPDDAPAYAMRTVRGPRADGPTYWLSGSGWGADGSLVHLSMTSTGGYVADWGDAATSHLQPCWTSDRPERP